MTVRDVRVGDVLRLERRLVEIDPADQYSAIGVRSFAKGLIRYPACTGSELSKMRYFELPCDSLVVSNIKAWEGAVALASPDDRGLVTSNRFLTYVPAVEGVWLRYIWHYFASDLGTRALSKASPGSADRNRTLGIKAFESLHIPFPSLERQRAIALRLDELSGMGTALEKMRSKRAALVASQQATVLANAPSSRPVALGKVLSAVRRETDIDEGRAYPMLGVRSFGRGAFDAGTLNGDATAYRRLRMVRSGDVVYPKLMAWEGAFAVVPPEFEGRHVSPEFVTFEVDGDRVLSGYLNHLLSDREFLKRFAVGSTGTNVRRRRLQPADFLKKLFPLPDLADQQRIVDQLDAAGQLAHLDRRQQALMLALPQAARNEVFSKLV